MIDDDFEDSVDDTADEDTVIMTMMKMHEITKMSILYAQMMSSDCQSYPDLMQSEDLAKTD